MFKNKQLRAIVIVVGSAVAATMWGPVRAQAHVTAARDACGLSVRADNNSRASETARVVMMQDGDRVALSLLHRVSPAVSPAESYAILMAMPDKPLRMTLAEPDASQRFLPGMPPWHQYPGIDRLQRVGNASGQPCRAQPADARPSTPVRPRNNKSNGAPRSDGSFGVTVHQRFSQGAYDVTVVSARMAEGLEAWLTHRGYRAPTEMSAAFEPHVRRNSRFLLARVNAAAPALDAAPLQLSLRVRDSRQLGLPMRLATLESTSTAQDMVLWLITPSAEGGADKEPRDGTRNRFDTRRSADSFYHTAFRLPPAGARGEGFWDLALCDPCVPRQPLGIARLNETDTLRVVRLHWRYYLDDVDSGKAAEQAPAPATRRAA